MKPERYVGTADEWWAESLKGYGWPEEGSRNLGTIEELYQLFRARLLDEIVTEHGDWLRPA